ncbi:hypothetical protein MRB53_006844 [Persea americana]|uniref:Uncharacterized protein n=1 Tax=Persea americana TaxID=3435 RepID=A0ACC2MI79_PERAE|nr:hypothetical protein MRB53_006844 [Persea americana]
MKTMAAILLILSLVGFFGVPAFSDPDALQDFCVANLKLSNDTPINGFVCKPASAVTSDDFFFDGLSKGGDTSTTFGAAVTPGNVLTFPGLNTLGLSMNRVDYAPGGLNPPHSHPHATELVLAVKGEILVGFVSTSNVFYSKVLKSGENFVIPRGLVHFQYNVGKEKAVAITTFDSQLPGVVIAASTLFGSKPDIPDIVLAKAFQVDEEIVKAIKSKF